MTHDDRCPGWFKEDEQISCPTCDLIARVREDERSLVAVERTTLAELNDEYRKGVQAAREAVAAAVAELKPVLARDYQRLSARDGAQEAENAALAAIDALVKP